MKLVRVAVLVTSTLMLLGVTVLAGPPGRGGGGGGAGVIAPVVTVPVVSTTRCFPLVVAAAPQEADPIAVEATPLEANAEIVAVTLYRDRAAVTRREEVTLDPGAYEMRFTDLPETVEPESIQARSSGPVRIMTVEFERSAVEAGEAGLTREIDAEIEAMRRSIRGVDDQVALLDTQKALIDAVGVRVTDEATGRSGTPDLDLDAIRGQLEFVAAEQARLLGERRAREDEKGELEAQLAVLESRREAIAGQGGEQRSAVVLAAVTEPSAVQLDLTYLVREASWQPIYNVRADTETASVQIEYDATIAQRTGEDWDQVALTLSTAQPRLAANPPQVDPVWVDVAVSEGKNLTQGLDRDAVRREAPVAAMRRAVEPEMAATFAAVERPSADASVTDEGPSVSFQLPRLVTIPTDARKQQRSRIAIIDGRPDFTHVAVPLHTDAVYVRGEVVNASAYYLLPGSASVFVGQDYVGNAAMASTPPEGEFELWLGVDQAVTTSRTLLNKHTDRTGFLNGERRTSFDYRIEIDNGSGGPVTVELWDRYPVSRHERINVSLVNLSHPLATDVQYTQEEKPLGLLKWSVSVPATARDRNALAVTYGVRVNRDKGVQMTGLPD